MTVSYSALSGRAHRVNQIFVTDIERPAGSDFHEYCVDRWTRVALFQVAATDGVTDVMTFASSSPAVYTGVNQGEVSPTLRSGFRRDRRALCNFVQSDLILQFDPRHSPYCADVRADELIDATQGERNVNGWLGEFE
ncbi:hypothetical protein LGM43_28630 [Burkholderia seminalis]|uniref:hypothetical protein n=1 Tax=Burkholderia seminalis TaxID=488731 RepID=UPI001CF2C970|nr:hypothetical protein [Burkholderia seminalis]MCA7954240.1 hypothetical protein [Burkholderia seminalis]